MIVVDFGCANYAQRFGEEESIRPLLRRFKPDLYFGFDIVPGMKDWEEEVNDTHCVFARRAAWTEEGILGVERQGNCTHILPGLIQDSNGHKDIVACFDAGAFLSLLPAGMIVKMDIEGAEYPVLWDLCGRGIDKRIGLLLVEFHPPEYANGWDRLGPPPLCCQVEEWG